MQITAIYYPHTIYESIIESLNYINFCLFLFRRFEAVERIYREVTKVYADSEIDWTYVHDAGCTRDDTDLPHHVTSQNDLDRLITGTFRVFLASLPASPTIVTVAR